MTLLPEIRGRAVTYEVATIVYPESDWPGVFTCKRTIQQSSLGKWAEPTKLHFCIFCIQTGLQTGRLQ